MAFQQAKEGFQRLRKEFLGYIKREIPTFGLESIIMSKTGWRLRIKLAHTEFQLPLVHLNFKDADEAAIGYFNPSPDDNPQIDEASTITMAEMLKKMKPTFVVMTNSTKSEHFIKKAVEMLPEGTTLIILPSGSAAEDRIKDVVDRSSEDELFIYTPVTGTKKAMGYPKKSEGQMNYITKEELRKLCPDGKGLVIVDDVYTTGATVNAMEAVLGLDKTSKHKVAVIAIEKQFDGETGQYLNKEIPKNVHAAFNLTEFLGLDKLGIHREYLHSFVDKKNIPPAIVNSNQV